MYILSIEEKVKSEITLVNKAIERGDKTSQAVHAYAVYLLNTIQSGNAIGREVVRSEVRQSIGAGKA